MEKSITYIYRKPNLKYFSIENLFDSISKQIGLHFKTNIVKLNFAGGSLLPLWKNLRSFQQSKKTIYHITGDVHYMALVTGKNTVLTIHDIKSALEGNLFKKLYIRFLWFYLPALFVNKITVISQFTKIELSRLIPFAKQKIRVIHNPINPKFRPEPYVFNSQNPQILFVGTKSNKNLERSIIAIKNIKCNVMIIGKLTDEQSALLEHHKIDYKNNSNLTFDDVLNCYKNCDLVCFASTYEGFGMPIIEAQAMGKPVVTSKFGAMLEVANASACLVDPYDADSIKEGILKICNGQEYRHQLISNGFKNIERFQPEFITQRYIELYKEFLD